MNPQQAQIAQAYQQQLGNMNPRGSALGQAVNQAQSYGGNQQQGQQSQLNIPQMLQGIGQFLHNIGHPIAQQFNQMHGFNFGQPQKQPAPQQPR